MKTPEDKLNELVEDIKNRAGFRSTWNDMMPQTEEMVKEKWLEIIKDDEKSVDKPAIFLARKYDHVLEFDRDKMKLSQLSDFDDYAIDQRICVNRNLHNGDTKHIKIKAKIREGDKLYIAGNEED